MPKNGLFCNKFSREPIFALYLWLIFWISSAIIWVSIAIYLEIPYYCSTREPAPGYNLMPNGIKVSLWQ